MEANVGIQATHLWSSIKISFAEVHIYQAKRSPIKIPLRSNLGTIRLVLTRP